MSLQLSQENISVNIPAPTQTGLVIYRSLIRDTNTYDDRNDFWLWFFTKPTMTTFKEIRSECMFGWGFDPTSKDLSDAYDGEDYFVIGPKGRVLAKMEVDKVEVKYQTTDPSVL